MRKKLRLAILEDSALLLNDLRSTLEDNHLGEVVVCAQRSDDFLSQMQKKINNVDALILDITLEGDPMNGIDVANRFNLPILFITSHTKEYIFQIESLKIDKDMPIEFLTKPLNTEKLINLFGKFEKSIQAFKKHNKLNLKVMHQRNGEIEQNNIMFIKSIDGSESNNKMIQLFNDEIPLEVSRISLGKFFELGLSEEMFVQTSQSYLVNKEILKKLTISRDKSMYSFPHKFPSSEKTFKIEITEKYWSNPKRK